MKRILYFVVAILFLASVAYAQSPLGGSIYKIVNNSGATLYRGQLVVGDSASAVAAGPVAGVAYFTGVDTCPVSTWYCIGTVYSESIITAGTGQYGFITTSGRGYVAVQYDRATTVIPGNRVLAVSADSSRKANCYKKETLPDHYMEIGQPVTKLYGKNAHGDSICIADIHKL